MGTMLGRAFVAAVALGAVAASGGCSVRYTGPGTVPIEQAAESASPEPLAIVEVRQVDGRTLELVSPSCHGAPRVEVVESDASVELLLKATVTNPGDGCQDLARVVLEEPLGDRDVVDATTGAEIDVG